MRSARWVVLNPMVTVTGVSRRKLHTTLLQLAIWMDLGKVSFWPVLGREIKRNYTVLTVAIGKRKSWNIIHLAKGDANAIAGKAINIAKFINIFSATESKESRNKLGSRFDVCGRNSNRYPGLPLSTEFELRLSKLSMAIIDIFQSMSSARPNKWQVMMNQNVVFAGLTSAVINLFVRFHFITVQAQKKPLAIKIETKYKRGFRLTDWPCLRLYTW